MSSRSILFYVSGHGYGHAVRAGEVVRALQRIRPDWRILARTQAPREMFPEGIEFSRGEFEAGVVEQKTGVVVDEEATLARLRDFLDRWPALASIEHEYVREQRPDLIVADIPAMAGDVAWEAGTPCVAIANFTWDWIYEPYASGYLEKLEQGYSRMTALLRLPFYQPSRLDVFPEIVDAPLIARKSGLSLPGSGTGRKKALLGSRAQVTPEALQSARASAPEFEFMTPAPGVNFTDMLAASDVVVAKLGFSMLAECIAARKPLLYPPRQGFREEELLRAHAHEYVTALAIPLADFYSGEWGPYLRELMGQGQVKTTAIRTDGAEFCAGYLANFRTS